MIYGLRVLGCTHDFFKPKNFEVICLPSAQVLQTRSPQSDLLDSERTRAILELEQHDVRCIRYDGSIRAKEVRSQ